MIEKSSLQNYFSFFGFFFLKRLMANLFKIGSKVETKTGKIGYVRYIGNVEFIRDKSKTVVGIDLIDAVGSTDGKENNKRYFNVCSLNVFVFVNIWWSDDCLNVNINTDNI